jgi:hypothetical protein
MTGLGDDLFDRQAIESGFKKISARFKTGDDYWRSFVSASELDISPEDTPFQGFTLILEKTRECSSDLLITTAKRAQLRKSCRSAFRIECHNLIRNEAKEPGSRCQSDRAYIPCLLTANEP